VKQASKLIAVNKMLNDRVRHFGFRTGRGGGHGARTMMLDELRTLLFFLDDADAPRETYVRAIEIDNCLGKRSGRTRKITARHLIELYALDPNITLFRSLLFFWKRDEEGQPLLALLCAFARDAILRMSSPFIFQAHEGDRVTREALEEFLDSIEPGRFSKAPLKSTAQNINSTWTQSGHLKGKVKKVRSRAKATSGSTAYVLFLAYLEGVRGEALFSSEYAKLLDCSIDRAIELAEEASRRGWIVFKRVGRVIEVLFPHLITEQEREWIREQS
jgi:hypothetical protein